MHASGEVHALPSSHATPFAAIGLEQRPFSGSHEPATWQLSEAAQITPAQGFAHGAQSPPQSTPVSVPFLTPSKQEGGA